MMQPKKHSNESASEDRSIDTPNSSLLEKSISNPANVKRKSGKLLPKTSTNYFNERPTKEKESATTTTTPLPPAESPPGIVIDREMFISSK